MTQFIQSIQQFSCTIPAGATSNTVTIGSVNTANAFILLQGQRTNESASMAAAYARAALTNGTTVTVTRNTSSSSTVTVQGLVIELTVAAVNSSVQRGTISLSGVTSNTATISAVGANAFVVHLGATTTTTSATDFNSAATIIELTNSTTVTAKRAGNTNAATVGYAVIDPVAGNGFLNSAPQYRTITRSDTNASFTDTISAVTPANTLLIPNGFTTVSGTRATALYALQLTGSTSVTMTRSSAGSSTSRTIAYTVLEFASGILNSAVQRGSNALSTTPVDTAVSSISTTWGGVNFTGLFSGSTSTDSIFATVKLQAATTVRAECDAATVSVTVGWEAFEFTRPGTTYNDTISESLALTDAVVGGFLFTDAVSDSMAASDSLSAAAVFGCTLAESLTLADALAVAVAFVTTLAEAFGATDSVQGGFLYADSLAEAVSPSDSVAATKATFDAISEQIIAGDAVAEIYAAILLMLFAPRDLFNIISIDRQPNTGPAALALEGGGYLVKEDGGLIPL